MVEFSKGLYLAKVDAFIPICVFFLHFLDRHDFAGFGVGGLVDGAESAVAEGFYCFVFLH